MSRRMFAAWVVALAALMPVVCVAQPVAVGATPPSSVAAPAVATSVAAAERLEAFAPIPLVSADVDNIRVASSPGAWGGPRTAGDETLSNRVTRYQIQARLDPDQHVVTAQQTLHWRNRSNRPVRTVYLHMYLNAFEGPGSTLMTERRLLSGSGNSRGSAVLDDGQWGHITLHSVTQNGADVARRWVHPDGGPETDHTVLALDLPQAVPPHGSLRLEMAFTSQLPRVVIRTGWWGKFHLVAQWFPKIAVLELPGERGATQVRWNAHEFHFHSEFYADYGSYDVSITVPEGYVVGAVGWQMGEPIAADGEWTYHFVQHDVEDFAWVAAPDYQVIETTWTGPGSPEVLVRVLYPPEYEAAAKPVQQATIDSLAYFSSTLGPYPYRTVTAVVPPYNASEAGGMEYPTFFTASGMTEYNPGTLSEFMLDFVTIHEFGHGYFMGILGSNEFEEPMLDEGMNEYWDQRMFTDRSQRVHLTSPWLRWLGFDPAMLPFAVERLSGVVMVDYPADSLGASSWSRLSNVSYGSVYSRTATTMRTLENLVGREAMARAMKLYYERWKFRHPSAADLRDALAEGTGRADLVHKIFESQVYGTDRIDALVVGIDHEEQVPRTGTYLVDGKRTEKSAEDVKAEIKAAHEKWDQAHPDAEHGGPYPWHSVVTVRRTGTALPLTVRVNFADGSHEDVQWHDGSPWKRFHFHRDTKAVSAIVDPDNKILLDVNLLNNSHAVEADSSASNRYGAMWRDLAATLFSFMVTL